MRMNEDALVMFFPVQNQLKPIRHFGGGVWGNEGGVVGITADALSTLYS